MGNWGPERHCYSCVRCHGLDHLLGIYTRLDTALLGESDVLTGQVISPRSPPDAIASFAGVHVAQKDWIVKGICAYVPQVKSERRSRR